MTTTEQINTIVEIRFNGYRGTMMKPLKQLHSNMRSCFGDEYFLKYLKQLENNIPSVQKYEIPLSARMMVK